LRLVGGLILFGVSYADAVAMTAVERLAMLIILGEGREGKWNWEKGQWDKKPTIM
jgi:hypothetical protein